VNATGVPLAVSRKSTVSVEIDEVRTPAPNCTSKDADTGYAGSPSSGVVPTGKFTQTVVLSLAVHPSGLVTATVYMVDSLGVTVGWAVVVLDSAQVGRSQIHT
jgi:hypothetical protein